MDSYPPRFDQLYSISDLHLGGRQGFQMFSQGPLLAGVIDRLRENMAAEERLALVINGDFIDFLAEHPNRYFNHQGAVADLERVIADPAFAPVFEALARFVATPRNVLVINLGNHDLELCLPAVQHALLSRLAGDDPVARDRIHIIADGSGYCCRVGGCKALFVHGNETDAWNKVDFSKLLAIKSARNSARTPPDFRANAGTRLVIEVLNKIKGSYRFVDLLKPEIPVVLAVLYAVVEKKSELAGWIRRLPGVLPDWFRYLPTFPVLGEKEMTDLLASPDLPESLAEPLQGLKELRDVMAVMAPALSHDALLETAWRQYQQDRRLEDLDDWTGPMADQLLHVLSPYLPTWMDMVGSRTERAEQLRKTLRETLGEDRSIALSTPDRISKNRDTLIGADVHFLVAGHTHLPRSLGLAAGQLYLNTGTWTDVLCFPADLLDDQKRFAKVFKALQEGAGAAELERLTPAMIRKEYTLAHLRAGDGGTSGKLLQANPDGGLTDVNLSAQFIRTP